ELVDDLAPEPGRSEDVRLVDAREALRSPARELEREVGNSPDLALGVPERVDGHATVRGRTFLGRPTEVEARRELADDEEVDAAASDDDVGPVDRETERRRGRVQDRTSGGHDLGTDAIARDRHDAVRHGRSSAPVGATNAELTLPISAPWSLLIATR